jgi:hypothetical protein
MTPALSVRSALLAALTDRQSRSALVLLAEMCRQSRELRDWLSDDFVRNTKTQENFLKLVDGRGSLASGVANDFAELAGEAQTWHEERRRIREEIAPRAPQLYGGLSWDELEKLVRRYEAGSIDVAVHLLVRDWRKAGTAASSSPRLLRAAGCFLDAVIRTGEKRLLSQLAHALGRRAGKQASTRAVVGYTDWWKLQALLYMLRNPRESYRTRDLRAHLATLAIEISSLDFRRFCKRHRIRRDERAGRPRTR